MKKKKVVKQKFSLDEDKLSGRQFGVWDENKRKYVAGVARITSEEFGGTSFLTTKNTSGKVVIKAHKNKTSAIKNLRIPSISARLTKKL